MISRFCAVLTLGLATFAPSVFATTYAGSDKSCIGLFSCSAVSSPSTYGGLTFTDASFSTVGNGDVTLGTFSLGTKPTLFAGVFDMDVTFSQPAGVSGSGSFDALLGGVVGFSKDGVAVITFDKPTTDVFSYQGGTFSLTLDETEITLCANDPVNLTATITGTSAAPEPTSMLLLGGGMSLLGLARFRKTAKA